MVPPRAVLFDMDGTLIDSLSDIAASLNHVLVDAGLEPHSLEDYKTLVGEGAAELVRRALPRQHASLHAELLARYKARYRSHLIVESRPYDGIEELLAELESRGVPKGIVTNKPHAAALEIVERLLGRFTWASVHGQRDGAPHKPHPGMALAAARELGVEPSVCLFVGDTSTDMQTARNAGMIAVGCLWGFRDRAELESSGADHVIAHPRELLALLG